MLFILTIISAGLLTAANYNGDLYFLSWFALLPFLYHLFVIKKNKLSYQEIFYSGWKLGFWILVFSANFLYHSIELYTDAPFIIIILLLVIPFLFLSLIYGIFFILYFYLQRKLFSLSEFNSLLFASVWTVMELTRYYLLGFFPIANPAYTQIEFLSFIQLAEIGGIWILSFILIYFNSLLFQFFSQKKSKNIFIIGLLFLVIFNFNHFYQPENYYQVDGAAAEDIEIGIITTQIKQEQKWKAEQLEQNIELTLNATSKLNQTRLIIAPETNLSFDFYTDRGYRENFLKQVSLKFKTPLQIGSLAGKYSVNGRYNSSFLISDTGKVVSRYDKNHLLYFGETYPFIQLLNQYTPYNFSNLKAGEEQIIFKSKDLQWKTVICSEILYPSYVKVRASELDFIVNQTNEAWFKDNKLLKNIMWQAAVLRAVENGIPVIKVGNQSHNGIIYPSGEYKKVGAQENYNILKLN